MEGWIKLDRKMLESSAFDNSLYFKVFCWCLLRASTKDTSVKIGFKDIPLKSGEFITSMSRGSGELKIHSSCLRRILKEMQNDNRIRVCATNKYTKITVVNWALYQIDTKNLTNNRQSTDNQPTNNRRQTRIIRIIRIKKKKKKCYRLSAKAQWGKLWHMSSIGRMLLGSQGI